MSVPLLPAANYCRRENGVSLVRLGIYDLISGTPLHNCLKDMYSLFRFLEVPVYQHYGNFRETFESRRVNGLKDGAIALQVLLRGMMMRRKKDDKLNGRPLIVLPPKV
jgi:SNF2 family DNA or RNA helicase